MRHESSRDRLLRLHRLLDEALRARDWARMGKIDRVIRRHLLEPAIRSATDPGVSAAKERLRVLHAKALAEGQRESERLRDRLNDHIEYADARATYQQVDLFQEG